MGGSLTRAEKSEKAFLKVQKRISSNIDHLSMISAAMAWLSIVVGVVLAIVFFDSAHRTADLYDLWPAPFMLLVASVFFAYRRAFIWVHGAVSLMRKQGVEPESVVSLRAA